MARMKITTVYLTDILDKRLRWASEQLDEPMASVLRRALEAGLPTVEVEAIRFMAAMDSGLEDYPERERTTTLDEIGPMGVE